jgi:phosphatidylglycerophosphatase A
MKPMRVLVGNLDAALEKNRLLTIAVLSLALQLRRRSLATRLMQLVNGRQRDAVVAVVGLHKRVEGAFGGAAGAKSAQALVAKVGGLAVLARGRIFADELGSKVADETAERAKAAAHDEEVGFDETIGEALSVWANAQE